MNKYQYLLSVGCLSFIPAVAFSQVDPVAELQKRIERVDGRLSQPPRDVQGAAERHLDVPYLAQWRDKHYPVYLSHKHPLYETGLLAFFDQRARCDIFVPQGDGPFPTLILVHGGSYTGGDKRNPSWLSGHGNDIFATGLQRKYVIVSANYILGVGIHPQVQRDTRELVRFLRANAVKYRIDPHRIGMVGASAGGWLTGASSLTTADDAWRFPAGWRYNTVPVDGGGEPLRYPHDVLLAGDSPELLYPDYSARLTVAMADFWDALDCGTPDDPHIFKVVSPGGQSLDAHRQENGLRVTQVELSKRGEHLPDSDQLVASAFGPGQVSLFERCLQFFDSHLAGEHAVTPAPEARPSSRWFEEQVEVKLAGSGPGVEIHYTLDGSEPTVDSPRYHESLLLEQTTTVRAISVAPGMKPSGVMTARFLKGAEPLEITAPADRMLPPATVGQPYHVSFEAPGAARWRIMKLVIGTNPANIERPARGQDEAKIYAEKGIGVQDGLSMQADGSNCVLSGTPMVPGWYTVLVAAAEKPGEGCPIAGEKLYMLRVDPSEEITKGVADVQD